LIFVWILRFFRTLIESHLHSQFSYETNKHVTSSLKYISITLINKKVFIPSRWAC